MSRRPRAATTRTIGALACLAAACAPATMEPAHDGATPDGALPDGALPDGATPDAARDDAPAPMDAATTRPFAFAGPTIALQAPDGTYVAAAAGGGAAVRTGGTALGPTTVFKVVDMDAGHVAFATWNAFYLSAGAAGLVATPTYAGAAETFTVLDVGGGHAVLATGDGHYVGVGSGGALDTTAATQAAAALFRVVDGGPARPLSVASVTDVGAMGHPAVVTARDDGLSVRVGANVVWLFGDSLLTVTTVDTGIHLRSSTGGWGSPTGNILPLVEALDAHGAPYELIPFTAAEASFNHAQTDGTRYAHWPSGVIQRDGEALIFYAQLIVHPGAYNYQGLGIGVAHLHAGATVATTEPALLFPAADGAQFGETHYIEGRYVYAASCTITGTLSASCQLGRAPVTTAEQRAAYTFWNGTAWVPDATHAARAIDGVGSSGISFAWCPYLRQYLAVYSPIFTDTLAARTAPSLLGPWSAPVTLATLAGTSGTNYAGREHPELRSADGATLVVSYAHPTGTFTEDMRIAHVVLH